VQLQQVKDKAVAEGDERHKQDLAEERDLRLSERSKHDNSPSWHHNPNSA
jgi:hypothetical protein